MKDEEFLALGLMPPPHRNPIPGPVQCAADILAPQFARDAGAPALIGRHARLSYGELDRAADAAAGLLRELGIGPGDRVAMTLANHPEVIIAFLAVQRIGAIWLGINTTLTAAERAHVLKDAEARLLIAEPDVLAAVTDELPIAGIAVTPGAPCAWSDGLARHEGTPRADPGIDPFAPAAIAYTSGTTGNPKGVVHSQHNMAVVAEARTRFIPWQCAPVEGVCLPLMILNVIIIQVLTSLRSGGVSVLIDTLYPPALAEWIARERIGSLKLAPPTLFDLLNREDIDRTSLATVTVAASGGAHVPIALRRQYREVMGHDLVVDFGLTEAPTTVATTRRSPVAAETSSGFPIEHLEFSVRDPEGRALPPGEPGEVCLRGVREGEWAHVYTPMLGYWKRPDATRETVRDGWLRTGDIGMLGEQGDVTIVDRVKNMIVRGGANVYPADIEQIILSVPGVAACSVFGVPDPRLGEKVAAGIELKSDGVGDREAILDEIKRRCAENLSRYKIPEFWHLVEKLPRNTAGKVVKARLSEMLGYTAAQ